MKIKLLDNFPFDITFEEEVSFLSDMAWTAPQYTKKEVDEAGKNLISYSDAFSNGKTRFFEQDDYKQYDTALTIINNWRSSHSFPLNTLQINLRRSAKATDSNCIVAQRIKRLSSIILKLSRFPTMKLSQMQDIGGCRAIVQNVQKVQELTESYKKAGFKHKLVNIDDYIQTPKTSGYRSIHLIYRYNSDKNETYNGLKIEMQLRSPLQHAWATAVETVGTFIRQSLKSSMGEEEWLRFFVLMGTAIAFREKTPPVSNTPTNKKELVAELEHYVSTLDVQARLKAYGSAIHIIEQPSASGAHYFLLKLEPRENRVTVDAFRMNELDDATKKYLDVERSITDQPGAEAVLVSVESLESLRRAYPNYFLDTNVFIDTVNKALSL